MPDPRKNEESVIRDKSVECLAESESSTYASCTNCGGHRTPVLHKDCTPVDSPQPGKEADGDVDAGVLDKKVNAASSSASPKAAAEKDTASASCSEEHDQKVPLTSKLAEMSLEDESGKEQPNIIISGVVDFLPGEVNIEARLAVVATTSSAGPSTILKGSKRKAEETEDGRVSSSKTFRKLAATSEAANIEASTSFWKDREPKILGDLPGSSGLGVPMQLLMESALDPMDIQPAEGVEPQLRAGPPVVPPFFTVNVASFSIDLNGGIGPFMDEHFIDNPEGVGNLEGLGVLLRANGEEFPTGMDQAQL